MSQRWAECQIVVNRARPHQVRYLVRGILSHDPLTGPISTDGYQAVGKVEKIGQVEAYSSVDQASSKGLLLLLPDGFGLAKHNFILADTFAREGFHVIIPDYFEGSYKMSQTMSLVLPTLTCRWYRRWIANSNAEARPYITDR